MNKLPYLLLLAMVAILSGCRLTAQEVPQRLLTGHDPLDRKLAKLVTVDSFAISAREAAALDALFLDAREEAEYRVSHLPNALPLGYRSPNYELLKNVARDQPLVVYCTVGYRSERLARQLRERGFTRVHNLYGSLYAWRLAGYPLEDANGPTDRMHTYNRKWGTLIPEGLGEKVY